MLYFPILFSLFLMAPAFDKLVSIGNVNSLIQISSKFCGSHCSVWKKVTMDVLSEHPDILFNELFFEEEASREYLGPLDEGQNVHLPMTILILNGDVVHYPLQKTQRHLTRWLNTVKQFRGSKWTHGITGLVPIVDGNAFMSGKYVIDDDVSLQLIGKGFEVPTILNVLANKLLSVKVYYVGTDNKTSGIAYDNITYLNTNLFKNDMRFDDRLGNLLHRILPPVIPFWMTKTDVAKDVIRSFATSEVHIIYDGELPSGWQIFAHKYPFTAFVHFRPNETTLDSPSVWIYNRSVDFRWNSVGHDVQQWYEDVRSGLAEPYYRRSGAPENPHPRLIDITGDTMWNVLRENTEMYMFLYNGTTNCTQFELVPDGIIAGRMDLSLNDHEALPEWAKAEDVFKYVDGRAVNVSDCNHFKWEEVYTNEL